MRRRWVIKRRNTTKLRIAVRIEVIPHQEQFYETVGDWRWDESGILVLRVSSTGDWRYEMLVAVHELIEAVLCKHEEISQSEVDDWDIKFEKERKEGKRNDYEEPGDDINAPYFHQHQYATKVEKDLAQRLCVTWADYTNALLALDKE